MSCVDELAPITDAPEASGHKPERSQPDKSLNSLLPISLSQPTQSIEPVRAFCYMMIGAIILATASLATEVIYCDVDDVQETEPPLLMTEKEEETVKKSIGQKLREKLQSMIRIRKGFTVDSGAADHVMPLGWLVWLAVTASFGSLRGVNFFLANGAKIPNKGQLRVIHDD